MAINLSNFVNINLNYQEEISSKGTREVVGYLDDGSLNTVSESGVAIGKYDLNSYGDLENEEFENMPQEIKDRLKWFFNLGGKKIKYVRYEADPESTITNSVAAIKSLSSEIIAIAGVFDNEKAKLIASALKSDDYFTGINEKMIFSYTSSTSDESNLENLVLKYGPGGIELSILAYLSNINVDSGTIKDYCYTVEDLKKIYPDDSEGQSTIPSGIIIDDNDTFQTLKGSNINCVIELLNDYVNYGGNTKFGRDLVNNYVKIILCQTLCASLTQLLKTKIRYNQNSVNLISAYITSELNKYKDYGYLYPDKVYTGEDQKDGDYLLISKNTKLNLGYKICILPISSLTPEQIKNHELPKIYLYLADSYSIRAITIDGTIIG